MTFENLIYLFIIVVLVVISGFFSGSETAITAVSKARIVSKLKQGNKKAGFVKKLLDKKRKINSEKNEVKIGLDITASITLFSEAFSFQNNFVFCLFHQVI